MRTTNDRYDEFKRVFEETYGKSWLDHRYKFNFIHDSIVEALVEMDFVSETAARYWYEKATGTYNICIEIIAKLVKEHIK